MKIALLLASILLIISFTFLQTTTFAHPGRTDANGGHTCRTNCEYYGLEYGEYHYHNGSGRNSSRPATSEPIRNEWIYEVIFWGFIAFIFIRILLKVSGGLSFTEVLENRPRKLIHESIEEQPRPVLVLPSPESVELTGYISLTKIRRKDFYVAHFRADENTVYTIVGKYYGRLYTMKPMRIVGMYRHTKYGMQVEVKNLEYL